MKGTVVMRFVGNRQEPEEFPVDPLKNGLLVFVETLNKKFLDEYEEWQKQQIVFACSTGPLKISDVGR